MTSTSHIPAEAYSQPEVAKWTCWTWASHTHLQSDLLTCDAAWWVERIIGTVVSSDEFSRRWASRRLSVLFWEVHCQVRIVGYNAILTSTESLISALGTVVVQCACSGELASSAFAWGTVGLSLANGHCFATVSYNGHRPRIGME